MVNKKTSILIIFILMFSLSIISSANIFKISGDTNAHSGTLSGSSYTNIRTLSHNVIGTNNILCLSGTNNAHIKWVGDGGSCSGVYSVGINVGSSYTCSLRDNSCNSNEECLVAISSNSNAHTSNCYGSGVYSKKVCCKYTPPCSDECTSNGCDGNTPYTCTTGSDGCKDKHIGNTCGHGYKCENGACRYVCTDDSECSREGTFCSSDGKTIYKCTKGSDGCLDYSVVKNCQGEKTCSSEDLTCQQRVCNSCDDCVDWSFWKWGFGCGCKECHTCSGGCFYTKGGLCLNNPNFCNGISKCSDYSSCECSRNPCSIKGTYVKNSGCKLSGNNCVECTQKSDCKDDFQTSEKKCNGLQPQIKWKRHKCESGTCSEYDNWEDYGNVCTAQDPEPWGKWKCKDINTRYRERTVYDPVCNNGECGIDSKIEEEDSNCGKNMICVAESSGAVCHKNRFWTDMSGNEISKADIGDSVLMWYWAGDISGSYKFDVKEEDLLFDTNIKTTPSFVLGNKVASKWVITQEDFDKGGSEDSEEFYFSVDNGDSFILNIEKDSYENSPPSTRILSPEQDMNYTIVSPATETQEILFKQLSSDEDDDLKIKWDFGDGSESDWKENCLTTGNCNDVTHRYSSSGRKSIQVTAKEMNRNNPQEAKNYTYINIYKEGLNIIPSINVPNTINGISIDLDGSKSKVVNCTSKLTTGSSWYQISNPDGSGILYCKDLPPPSSSTYDIIFKWIFDEGYNTQYRKEVSIIGSWNKDYDKVVKFKHIFDGFGEHTIKLNIGYVPLN